MSSPAKAAVTFLILVLGMTGISAANPLLGSSSQQAVRTVVEQWAAAMGRGDQRTACGLQIEPQVDGSPCYELPTRRVIHGCSPHKAPPRVRVRSVSEQVGRVEVGAGIATAVVRARVLSSHYRATLELKLIDTSWRIDSLRRGRRLFAPAGLIAQSASPVYSSLWRVCIKPI